MAAPVILSVAQFGNKMIVTFNLVTGDKGADKATVEISDDKGAPYSSITVGTDASTAVRSVEYKLRLYHHGKYYKKIIKFSTIGCDNR